MTSKTVKVLCHNCKKENVTTLYFGIDKRYPDDCSIDCSNCDNWEEGQLPLQNFDIIEEFN